MMRHGRVALAALAAAGGFTLPNALPDVLPDARQDVATGGPPASPRVEQPLPALTRSALAERYARNRQTIISAARAARAEDPAAAVRLADLAAPGRRFLTFGHGRAVEVIGDLAGARRVAVLVPGADTTPATFDSRGPASPGGGARALFAEARRIDPRSRLAVVAWLGYEPPRTLSVDVATTRRADEGARALRPLTGWLNEGRGDRRPGERVRISLLCHSYGSVVCARAARQVNVADIAVFGSPGMTVSSVRGLRTTAQVWAGRAGGDWTAYVPKIRVLGLGFGGDPVGRAFGARPFATGDGGHSDYLRPGGVSLRNLALIALGHGPEATS